MVHDQKTGIRVAKVTKQRDLDTYGQELTARLEPIAIGKNQWGEPVTACVVTEADAPAPAKEKKIPQGAVVGLEALKQAISGRW
jgi:hypothetical protein